MKDFNKEHAIKWETYENLLQKVDTLIDDFQKKCEDIAGKINLPNAPMRRIEEEGLPTWVARACLTDKERTKKLGYAIAEAVVELASYSITKPTVVDVGTGTGILAYLAYHLFREVNMQPKIFGIEIEEDTAEIARQVMTSLNIDNIDILCGDGREICSDIDGPIDGPIYMVISENLYTGLFEEHQIELARSVLVRNEETGYQSQHTVSVPRGICLSLYLANTVEKLEHPTSSSGIYVMRVSPSVEYLSLDFCDIDSVINNDGEMEVSCSVKLQPTHSGRINAIGISMLTRCGYDDHTFLHSNHGVSLGQDEIFPISDMHVSSNKTYKVTTRYAPGTSVTSAYFILQEIAN